MSRLMLALHTLVFSSLVIGCVASPFIALSYPEQFNQYVLWVFGALVVLILGSWWFYGGDCPLTIWENNLRKREGKQTYSGSCIEWYGKEWFGVQLPRHSGSVFPLAVLLIPIFTRFFI